MRAIYMIFGVVPVEPTHEATEIQDSELGTEAATPKALAEAAGAHQSTELGSAKPSAWATASKSMHRSSAAEVLDKSDLTRSRMFHFFGITAPLGAVAMSVLIGGDPDARLGFWAGISVLCVCNMFMFWMSRSAETYKQDVVGVLWIASTLGAQPAVYYFGPFSAVVMVDILGIVFIALGRARRDALITAAICIVGHIAITIPIMLGWVDDVGILPSFFATKAQLVTAECLICLFLTSAYLLGRWARKANLAALNELQSAMRVIGDQQNALAEVVDAQERQKRANEGRWSGQQMGSFRLGLVLGRGAMGEVYEAQNPDGKPVAVKLLNARATSSGAIVERFHREMEIAARLVSPHIVHVYEVSGPNAPVPFIAMERLHGTDLATRLRDEPRMPSDELVVLLDQVARGLEVARLAGVVHRDLKPHNLFQHDGATWKILDFGVSKVLDSEGTLTGEGIVGTPQYMAPEQASGGKVTHVADVYALGAIAYRCLTGRSPFKGKDLSELVYQVVHVPPARPSSLGRVSLAIEEVLAVAMAKDPRRRFPSALSFAQAFIAARRGRAVKLEVPDKAWT
jgi:serine/threonine-protein kinase